jgi:hypothetical protein
MNWEVTAEGASDLPIDWPALRAAILARLDLRAEYTAFGARFVAEKPNSKGVIACHAIGREDSRPSAFVNVRTGLYHDSGSGESLSFWDAALKYCPTALGRHIEALRHFGEKVGIDVPTPQYHSGGRIREAVYDYRAEDGSILFRVFRYRLPAGGKSFSQHPPDGKGGWRHGPGAMDGVRLVPYRLPELVASEADQDPVWIVEGEKDADRLAALGLIATCNPMGAGKWRDEFQAHFAGRVCYVLPDNDAVGRQHAQAVCASLAGTARSVKVVELPDLPPKGDVSDWLDAGGTVEDLGQRAYTAPDWSPRPPAEAEPPRRWATLADIRQFLAVSHWAWEGWIPAAHIAGIAAFEGVGKSRFALDLCRRAYLGLPWPDGSPMTLPPGTKSLWICSDSNQGDLARFAPLFGLPDAAVVFPAPPEDPFEGTDLDVAENLRAIEQAIADTRPGLVFIDTLTSATSRDLCSQQTVKPLKASLFYLAQTYRTPIILLLHVSKEGQALGRRIKGVTRVLMHLECPEPEEPERLRLWVEKTSDKKPRPLGVRMADGGNEYDRAPMGRKPIARNVAKGFILNALRDRNGQPLMGLLNDFLATGGTENTFWRARDELVESGELTCEGRPKLLHLVNGAEAPEVPF